MPDLSFGVWVLLVLGVALVALVFMPGRVWSWALRQLARAEGKSEEHVKREAVKDLGDLARGGSKNDYLGGG